MAVTWADGSTLLAAKPPDYVYPSDVRIDVAAGILFVKADGNTITLVGDPQRTLLYRYDLVKRQLMEEARVKPEQLPAECKR